ncbi:hypothetical protein EJD97_014797 [Solanum chilense]|uniref:Uncharacterized protein n=1 Tax=Solanum chilense TaxID=4083 RepID=A0A6N2BDE7_SOLCI|nr:hypothetical protein EJD97_014797 [Solanum chilense]
MKEAITSLECRLIEVLNTEETITSLERQLTEALGMIETLKAEVKAFKEGVEVGGSVSPDRDREAKVEAPKPSMFKGVRDAQELENFLWHLENHFKCNRRKTEVAKRGGCYICGGPHGYARCLELKSFGAILRERKEKEAHEQEQGAKVNIMTKTAATRLGLRYSPSNAQLRMVNAPPTPVSGVAHGVSITLGEWQGKARKTEGQVRLTAMQLEKSNKRKGTTYATTIASSREDNGAKKSLPLRTKKVPRENNVVMPKKPPRPLPPRKELDREAELEEMKKQLKELREGIDRVNGLLVARTRRQNSVTDEMTMRRGRRINRWGRVPRPATS